MLAELAQRFWMNPDGDDDEVGEGGQHQIIVGEDNCSIM